MEDIQENEMSIEVSVKAVKVAAEDAGLPESIVERHMDALCSVALTMKATERKRCKNQLRKWLHENPLTRDDILSIL
jgi:hypothetical protein